MSELRRLGRREAYRLGTLRTQGVAQQRPPRRFRLSFLPRHRGPATAWALGLLAGFAAIAAGATAALWFVPFIIGLLAGVCGRLGRWRPRVTLPAAAAMAVAGWGVPLGLALGRVHLPELTGRVSTAMPGLPVHSARGLVAAAGVAAAQALAGAGLGLLLTRGAGRSLWP